MCALPPRDPCAARSLAGVPSPPCGTHAGVKDHGAGGCFPYSPLLRAPAPSQRLGESGAEGMRAIMARLECVTRGPAPGCGGLGG